MTERWAARFVTELFRHCTVCFVGYSINDPVLRYMMDALAADRLLGESPPEMFAFGSYAKGKETIRANEWCAKNVTPILYREHDHHSYEWINTQGVRNAYCCQDYRQRPCPRNLENCTLHPTLNLDEATVARFCEQHHIRRLGNSDRGDSCSLASTANTCCSQVDSAEATQVVPLSVGIFHPNSPCKYQWLSV